MHISATFESGEYPISCDKLRHSEVIEAIEDAIRSSDKNSLWRESVGKEIPGKRYPKRVPEARYCNLSPTRNLISDKKEKQQAHALKQQIPFEAPRR